MPEPLKGLVMKHYFGSGGRAVRRGHPARSAGAQSLQGEGALRQREGATADRLSPALRLRRRHGADAALPRVGLWRCAARRSRRRREPPKTEGTAAPADAGQCWLDCMCPERPGRWSIRGWSASAPSWSTSSWHASFRRGIRTFALLLGGFLALQLFNSSLLLYPMSIRLPVMQGASREQLLSATRLLVAALCVPLSLVLAAGLLGSRPPRPDPAGAAGVPAAGRCRR